MDINGVDRLGRTKAGDHVFVHNCMVGVCIPSCPCVKQARSLFLRLSCSAKGGEGIDLQTRSIELCPSKAPQMPEMTINTVSFRKIIVLEQITDRSFPG